MYLDFFLSSILPYFPLPTCEKKTSTQPTRNRIPEEIRLHKLNAAHSTHPPPSSGKKFSSSHWSLLPAADRPPNRLCSHSVFPDPVRSGIQTEKKMFLLNGGITYRILCSTCTYRVGVLDLNSSEKTFTTDRSSRQSCMSVMNLRRINKKQ